METLEQIQARIRSAVPGAQVELVANGSAANQPSLLLGSGQALAVVTFLRDDPQLRFDYASNVTGVDWPDLVTKEKVRVKRMFKEQEIEVDEKNKTSTLGIFAAGDITHSPFKQTIIAAGEGAKAAMAVAEYLLGETTLKW